MYIDGLKMRATTTRGEGGGMVQSMNYDEYNATIDACLSQKVGGAGGQDLSYLEGLWEGAVKIALRHVVSRVEEVGGEVASRLVAEGRFAKAISILEQCGMLDRALSVCIEGGLWAEGRKLCERMPASALASLEAAEKAALLAAAGGDRGRLGRPKVRGGGLGGGRYRRCPSFKCREVAKTCFGAAMAVLCVPVIVWNAARRTFLRLRTFYPAFAVAQVLEMHRLHLCACLSPKHQHSSSTPLALNIYVHFCTSGT